MNKEFTNEELIEIIVKLKEAILYIRNNKNIWYGEVGRLDKALSDIRHCAEFNYPNTPEDRDYLLKLLNTVSTSRRVFRDKQDLFVNVHNAIEDSRPLFEAIDSMVYKKNLMDKGRVYNPRELTSLFKKNHK